MIRMPAVIVDIDGTIADLTHRLHHVKNGKHNWDQFFAEVKDDKPYWDVIQLVRELDDPYVILLVSGRPEKTRADTVEWLEAHDVPHHALYMRKDGDTRQDTIVKSEILDELVKSYDIAFTIDDRPSVVKMWRERGVTCLQCRDWDERDRPESKGTLYMMVGPSGAGKSHWLKNWIFPSAIVSSDVLRHQLCGDFKDQSKNDEVFAALHAVVKTRIEYGLDTVVDATNIRTKDRKTLVDIANGGQVVYVVIDRPLEEKRKDGGWRNEIKDFDLIGKHHTTFQSNLKDILRGDGYSNVTVKDYRKQNV